MKHVHVPTYDKLMNPLITALQTLGGSGTIVEIDAKVAEIADVTDEQLEVLHTPEKGGGKTEIEYRLAWARTYLKKYGVLENSSRGIWALTPKGTKLERVDPKAVQRFVRNQLKATSPPPENAEERFDEETQELSWREELLQTLCKMEPAAFERLVQRILRESGFIQVEVTGKSGDGGIDGKGIMRLGGLLSFHVIFQCKRYQGSVSSGMVRDFRGAMVGRADKGLLITTGNFTKDATREATRDGAPAIDLIDGELLVEKLRDLELGVKTEIVQVKQISIDHEWFLNL